MGDTITWQDAYIAELVDLLARIARVVDGCPEIWADLERAGIRIGTMGPE
jgi:hypothetical protein